MEDICFFGKDKLGRLQSLPRKIANASGAALKQDNQKNGWKGIPIYHETNGGKAVLCPVRAIRCCYMNICTNGGKHTTYLSAQYINGKEYQVYAKHIQKLFGLRQWHWIIPH